MNSIIRYSSTFILFALTSLSHLMAQIPDDLHSPFCRVSQRVGMTDIEIAYSRPSLKGRILYGELIQEGKEWRTGANAATTIRFDDPVLVDGKKLKAGIYSLYTIPGQDKWKVIFNLDIYSDPYEGRNKPLDVLLLEVPVQRLAQPMETFTIFVSNLSKDNISANIDLMWDKTLISLPIEVPNKWAD